MKGCKTVVMASVFALCLGGMMSGCAKKAVETPAGDKGAAAAAESLETPASDILEGRTSAPMLPVYFDFDKSDIRANQVERIEKNADFLKQSSTVRIRIEGNCDERGTNEYNMALGERRAQSAKKYLVNLGVADARLETLSFGEEKPLLFGHDELSWDQNRRDDFVIIK